MQFFAILLCLYLAASLNYASAQQTSESGANTESKGSATSTHLSEIDIYSDEAAYADDEFEDADEAYDEDLDTVPTTTVNDPLEGFNRAVFSLNDKLYVYLLKPVAKAYRVIPEPVRTSVSNFYSNLTTPIRLTNALLQGKFSDAGGELARFMLNSTIGLGGLFDPADKLGGLRKKDEDFGQTLGAYGVDPGIYIVLPFFGPSSARDAVGLTIDTLADPANHIWEDEVYWAAKGLDYVNAISLDKDTYEAIKRDSFDPYLFIRDAYMKNRQRKVEQ